jgi:hypothetical protein
VLIEQVAFQVALCLVGTLHEILLPVPDDADRIKTYDFHQGIFKAETLEMARNGKVLQIVINERYLMASGSSIQVFEHMTQ